MIICPLVKRFVLRYNGTYTIEDLQPEALLFQTGYVTIKDAQGSYYTLGYPNDEVKSAFITQFLYTFAGPNKQPVSVLVAQLAALLQQEDFAAFAETIQALFAHIPYPEAARQDEAHFHVLFYLMVAASGMPASPELLTNRGRIDLAVELSDQVFVMEFKCNQSVQSALQQIRAKGYAERYRQSGKRVFLMGFNFSTEELNQVDWGIEGPVV
ncbi:MAG: PD-(D/E)XK nuclease domain-containing protein [Anaerolineae bacterium]|nr:PD-(D/E)XK nuclease domain-containing protein [Anaerolineae bacterium]